MARRVVDRSVIESEIAAQSLDSMVASRRTRRSAVSKATIEREIADIERRVAENDWRSLKPAQLVAVYAWCHDRAYGVRPDDLTGATWSDARKRAGLMVKRDFGGDVDAALEFLRWVWGREEGRIEWKKANGRPIRRLTWHDQFTARWLLSDYRVDQSVRQGIR